jgi:hypothetical protein
VKLTDRSPTGNTARVEEPGLTLVQAFPYSGPLEDVRLEKQ